MYTARPAPSRRKHLESREPVHRLDRCRPQRQGPRRSRSRPACCCARLASASTSPTRRSSSARSAPAGSCSTNWICCGFRPSRDWRLNERHYGALQGLNKAETAAKHGEAQIKIWRRSYDMPPPPLEPDDPRHPSHDPRYADLQPQRAARDRIAEGHRRALRALLERARSRRTCRPAAAS